MELIETSTFTKQITALLSDEEFATFQNRFAVNPELGDLIKGGGGRPAAALLCIIEHDPALAVKAIHKL